MSNSNYCLYAQEVIGIVDSGPIPYDPVKAAAAEVAAKQELDALGSINRSVDQLINQSTNRKSAPRVAS